MSSPTLTRRALLAGAGTAIASAGLAVPYMQAVHAEDAPRGAQLSPHLRITEAVHELRAAMSSLGHGQWMVLIREGGTANGAGNVNAMIFDGSGAFTHQIDLTKPA